MIGIFHRVAIAALLWVCFLLARSPAQIPASQPQDKKWTLVWSDEFNSPDGSAVDSTKWVFDVGGEGWGNQELEYYTNRVQNAHIESGNLVIEARAEKYKGADGKTRDFTSARIKTLGKFSRTYGRFEARLKMPYGQGLWPAFWMLGDDVNRVGWPACGEIDIMENIGREPSVNHGSIHGPGYVGGDGIEAHYTLSGKKSLADDFHTYAVEWDPDEVRFYVDDDLYATQSRANLRPGQKWVFDHPFFLLLNVAVGGDWPGSPDGSTVFPQRMLVDYVRVYGRPAAIAAQDVSQHPALPTLTSADQVRRLSPDQAGLGYPVRIRGVITDDVPSPDYFIQDSTSGIYVEGSHVPVFPHVLGDVVEVEGITGPGKFAPVVRERRVRAISKGTLPKARLYTFSEVANGQLDSQRVQIRGTIRATSIDRTSWHQVTLAVNVASGNGQLKVGFHEKVSQTDA